MKSYFFILLLFVLLFFVCSFNFVNAFGVSTLYSANYPLNVKPGEIKETFFLIRNVVEGDSNVVVSVELVKGAEIASLNGDSKYNLPFGEEVEVPVKLVIPADAKPGDEYLVAAIFRPIQTEGSSIGDIQFIVNIGKSFPVVVSGGASSSGGEHSLTLVEDEGIVQSFAPFIKKNLGFFLIIIVIIAVGIMILITLIVFMVIKNREIKTIENRVIQSENRQGTIE